MVAGISMYSLLFHHKQTKELHIFMIDNGITQENKDIFIKMCEKYGRSITFIPIADIEKIAGRTIDIGRWNISTFARLFYASLLPEWVEKVIHIDCDTMIMDSLEPLWDMDMGDSVVAGALECIGDNYKTEVGLKKDDYYINAGNVMFNLKEIRKRNLEEDFRRFIHDHSILSFVDQAVLNGSLSNEDKIIIPLNYNAYSIIYYVKYKNLKKAKRVTSYYSEEEVEDAKKHPRIVHFYTCFMDGTRPWMEHNRHPMVKKYLGYKEQSPWRETSLWKDNRSALKKASTVIFNILPQSFVTWTIGVIHAIIIPNINKLKARSTRRNTWSQ